MGKFYDLEYVDVEGKRVMRIYTPPKHEGEERGYIYPQSAAVLESRARIIAHFGGKQGGKSYKGPIWVYGEICDHPGTTHGILGPDWPTLNRQVIPYFLDFIDQTPHKGHWDAQKHIYYLNPQAGGGEVQFFAADTPADARKLESVKLQSLWIDEGGQMDGPVIYSAKARVALVHGRILVTTTPYLKSNVLKESFYDPSTAWRYNKLTGTYFKIKDGDPGMDIECFLSSSADNPEFDQRSLDEARRELPPSVFKMMYQGDLPEVMGAILPEFSYETHVAQGDKKAFGLTEREWLDRLNLPQAKDWIHQIGHDIGYGHPSASMFMGFDPEMDKLIICKEIYLEGDRIDSWVDELARYNSTQVHKFRNVKLPLDGAALAGPAQQESEAKKYGFYFSKAQDDPEKEKLFRDVETANLLLRGLIANGRIVFLGSYCPRVIEEIPRYHRDQPQSRYHDDAQIVKIADDGICGIRAGLIEIHNRIRQARKEWEKKAAERRYPVGQYSPADPVEHKKSTRGKITIGGKRFKVRVRI